VPVFRRKRQLHDGNGPTPVQRRVSNGAADLFSNRQRHPTRRPADAGPIHRVVFLGSVIDALADHKRRR
jgi:hypothetical protein